MEVVPLVSGCCTLPGRVDGHHWSSSIPNSLTCWLQMPHPGTSPQLRSTGHRPRQMKFPQELNGYVFKTKARHLNGRHRLWSGMERDGLRHATLPMTHYVKMTTTTPSIPARSSPGKKTAPSVASHQDGGEKYATDGPKSLRARNNITIGTCKVRSPREAGKVEELTHQMKRYLRNILGLCEVR